jgi:hypothetical protein
VSEAPTVAEMYARYADWCATTGARLYPRADFERLLLERPELLRRLLGGTT